MEKLLATTVLAVFPFGAFAADLPVRSAAPAPVLASVASLGGFYAGVAGGAMRTEIQFIETNPTMPLHYLTNTRLNWAPVFGGLAGYNFQRSSIVYGLEFDLESARYSQEIVVYDGPSKLSNRVRSDFQGSLRARLGYTLGDALIYVTGGIAAVRTSHKFQIVPGPGYTSGPDWRLGWTLGAGAEYALLLNWRARFEYRYTRLSYSEMGMSGVVGFDGYIETTKIGSHALRAGVVYQFGGSSAPVVARY